MRAGAGAALTISTNHAIRMLKRVIILLIMAPVASVDLGATGEPVSLSAIAHPHLIISTIRHPESERRRSRSLIATHLNHLQYPSADPLNPRKDPASAEKVRTCKISCNGCSGLDSGVQCRPRYRDSPWAGVTCGVSRLRLGFPGRLREGAAGRLETYLLATGGSRCADCGRRMSASDRVW